MGKIWKHIKSGNLYRVVEVKRCKTESGWEKQPRIIYEQLEPCNDDQILEQFDMQLRWESYMDDFLVRFEKFS